MTGPWPGLRAFLTGSFGDPGDWSPLVTMLHWALFRAFGDAPLGYRLTSLALHWGVAVLLYRAARRLLGREDLAFAVALLWSLFPSHAEVLAQTSFKKHQLVALFALLMLESRADAGKVVCFVLALLCRESGLLLLPLQFFANKESRKPSYVMAAVAVVYAFFHVAFLPRALTGLMGGSLFYHLLTSSKILSWHLCQLALPISQSQEHSLSIPWFVPMLLAVAAVYSWKPVRKDPVLSFSAAWALLFLLPFTNILPYLNVSLTANRYHYMASAGFLLFVARLVERRKPSKRAVFGGAAAIGLFYCAILIPHAALYASPVDLWAQAAHAAPDNLRARLGYGAALREEGRYAEAVAELDAANRLGVSPKEVYQELALAAHGAGDATKALSAAQIRWTRRQDALGYALLGTMQLADGWYENHRRALFNLRRAYELSPTPEVAFQLGLAEAANRRHENAIPMLEQAASVPALRAQALAALARSLDAADREDEALKVLEESAGLEPLSPDDAWRLAVHYSAKRERSRALAVMDEMIARLEGAPSEQAKAAAAPYLKDARRRRQDIAERRGR